MNKEFVNWLQKKRSRSNLECRSGFLGRRISKSIFARKLSKDELQIPPNQLTRLRREGMARLYVASVRANTPKIIWTFWDKGEENAPFLVQECFRSWREKNPDWKLNVLDRSSIDTVVDLSFVPSETRIQLIADALRVELLRLHGGVWVDATVLCTQKLDSWLPGRMEFGFFFPRNPSLKNYRPLGNWFLAATPESYAITAWSQASKAYWKGPNKWSDVGLNNRPQGLLYHFMFEWLTINDPYLDAIWRGVPSLESRPSHIVQAYLKGKVGVSEAQAALSDPTIPVHKLNWRVEIDPKDWSELLQQR